MNESETNLDSPKSDCSPLSTMSSSAGSDPNADLVNDESNVSEVSTSANFRSTGDFPPDPSRLTRSELEHNYREMRHSHKFLVRSRAQLRRRSQESKDKYQDLLDIIDCYEKQYSAIGRERTEQFELARELKQKLEAFEKSHQDLDQLLSQVEDVHGEGGFWSFLKVTELLRRMRELFLSSGVR